MKWECIPDVTGQHSKEDIENNLMFWQKQHNIIANAEYTEKMRPVWEEERKNLVAKVKPFLGNVYTVTDRINTLESANGNEHYYLPDLEDDVLCKLPEYTHVKVTIEVIGPND